MTRAQQQQYHMNLTLTYTATAGHTWTSETFSIRWQQVPRFLSCTRLIYKHTPFPTVTGASETTTNSYYLPSALCAAAVLLYFYISCVYPGWKEKEGLERERRTIRGLYIGGCLAGELNNNKNTRFIIQHLPRRAQKTRKRDRREMVMFSRYPSSATESEKKL